MKTWHIHIEGRVQGVGFRPFIYRLANKMNLKGDVANTPDGVHIHIVASKAELDDFVEKMKSSAPKSAKILAVNYVLKEDRNYTDFEIIESANSRKPKLLITPDLALCESCRKELHDESNKRYQYAFITCTECGPRFSIMKNLPYDRNTTAMKPFNMCSSCEEEYAQKEDKRFYSQTNSCQECGIKLSWLTNEGQDVDPIKHTVRLLNDGKIVAVKGIGGFLLLVDATNKKAVERLRKKKMRPAKPLACLFKDMEQVQKFASVSEREAKSLRSAAAPIVLLKAKKNKREFAFDAVAPGLNRIGAMLPYAPLLEMICAAFDAPLVATSANASGSPIVYNDLDALRLLGKIADAILTNNREIIFPQDDSVVLFTPKYQQKIIIRRGRGMAPSVNFPEGRLLENTLAMGAEMKSAFAFTASGNSYLSQYLGDTSNYESQESYDHTLKNLRELMVPVLKGVAIDSHPNYHSSQKGRAMAAKENLSLFKIQHHKAHFASVLADNDLMDAKEPILGVVWDGLGHGDDNNVWGSEFFLLDKSQMDRVSHLGYFPMMTSNRMSLEPAIAAYAIIWPESPGKVWLRKRFSDQEQDVFPQLAENPKQFSSSMGRLFDAVAGVLEIKNINTYEGEAALALQTLAEKSKLTDWRPYCIAINENNLDAQYLLHNIDLDCKNHQPKEDIAYCFHQTLVQWIAYVADTNMVANVAFSGGVFQNSLLVDLIIERLKPFYKLYFHNELPPNDECIAVGQLAYLKIESNFAIDKESMQQDVTCV